MSETHSLALKARWAKVSLKERSKRMSALAKKKQASLSPEEKRRHALKMVKGRKVFINKKSR